MAGLLSSSWTRSPVTDAGSCTFLTAAALTSTGSFVVGCLTTPEGPGDGNGNSCNDKELYNIWHFGAGGGAEVRTYTMNFGIDFSIPTSSTDASNALTS